MPDTRSTFGSALARLGLFALLLFAVWNALDGFDFFQVLRYQLARRDVVAPATKALLFAGAYFSCLAGLVVLYVHARRPVRWAALFLTVVAVTIDLGFARFNGYGFTYHEASLIWSEAAFISDALDFGLATYLPFLIGSTAAAVAFERWLRPRLPALSSPLWLVVPLVAGGLTMELLERTHTKVYQVPVPYRVAMLAEHTWRHRLLYYGKRDAPHFAPSGPPLASHILMVVDESVTGDMLGINGDEHDTTPFLASRSDEILNYGVASAISNLSSTSNIVMQSGVRLDQIPDRELRALKNPNVFSYMQAAGLRAFMIDAQIYSDKPTNLMTGFDLEALDGHLFVRVHELSAAEHEMDFRALDHVEAIIDANPRTFVYLVKSGAHFPYDAKYPPEETHFRPTLASGGEGGNLEKTRNSYRNAIRWTVDAFLAELVRRFEARGTDLVVLYTADHGQSLDEAVDDEGATRHARPSRWPHAQPIDPPPQQASVPLLLLATRPETREVLHALYRPSLRDRASAFAIFPTLLRIAGYDEHAVRERYGPTLFDPAPQHPSRRFVSGNLFGIGGGFYQNRLIREATYLNDFDPPCEDDCP